MTNPIPWSAVVLGAMMLSACGGGPEVIYRSETADDANFTAYRTLAFAGREDPPGGYEPVELPEAFRGPARQAVIDTLSAAGWSWVDSPGAADVVFVVSLGSRERESDQQVRGAYWVDTYTVEVLEATIIVDAYDRRDRTHLWSGSVTGVVRGDPDRERTEAEIQAFRDIIEELFLRFPRPGTATGDQPEGTAGGETT
ncbi:MAG: DUF4136 domain-containing protein [Sandaracinaceae bacterium]